MAQSGMYGIDTRLPTDWKPRGPQAVKSVPDKPKRKTTKAKKRPGYRGGPAVVVRKGAKRGKKSRACRCVESKKNGRTYCFKHVGRKNIRACKPGKRR